MEREDNQFSTSEREIERSEISNNIEDIDKLATRPPQKVKPYQENFIEEKSSKTRIAESQESTRGKLAFAIISIYGTTILLCFATICFGIAEDERKELLTLTSEGFGEL